MSIFNSPWVVVPKPVCNSRMRLFCLPFAGAGASIFRTWPKSLPSQVEVCAIQLPGREDRLKERPFTRLKPLVQELTRVLIPYLGQPFALFGHSLGAAVAYECAWQLQERYDLAPVALFASGRAAPQLPGRSAPVHRLPDGEFRQRLRDFNGTPEYVLQNDELMELFLPLIRADFELNETYRCTRQKRLACPIFAFRGSRDPIMTYDEVAAWREQTSGTFALRTIPGDHFFIQNAQDIFLPIMAHDLGRLLQKMNGQVAPLLTVNGRVPVHP